MNPKSNIENPPFFLLPANPANPVLLSKIHPKSNIVFNPPSNITAFATASRRSRKARRRTHHAVAAKREGGLITP
jgi:hypothetical protein